MNKIFTLILLLSSISLSAQNWDVITEDNSYKIEKSHVVCKSSQGFDYDFVVMKYTNKEAQELELQFNFEQWYDDVCPTCVGDHGSIRTILIPANSSIEGSCTTYQDYLRTFDHSITNHPKAYSTKLTQLVINQVENK